MELKEKGLLPHKSYVDIANDLRKMIYKNYLHYDEKEVFKIGNYGCFFPEMISDPHKYIEE